MDKIITNIGAAAVIGAALIGFFAATAGALPYDLGVIMGVLVLVAGACALWLSNKPKA